MLRFSLVRLVALAGGLVLSGHFQAFVSAQEWTRFRGPNGSGVGEAEGLPATFTEQEMNWKVKLPGKGNGSPVLWGDKIFLLAADSETATRMVLCLAASDGRTLWSQKFETPTHHLHDRNSYATSTPAVDAECVVVAWSTDQEFTVMAFDHAGKSLWQKNLGPFVSDHGFGTSPMFVNDLVVLNNHQMGDPTKLQGRPPGISTMVALDRKTGEVRWQTPRKSMNVCYSVPCLWKSPAGVDELICTSTTHGMFSLNPQTGKENWSLDVFDKRTVSSPIIANGALIGTTGEGSGNNAVVGVQPGPQPKELYRIDKSMPYCPTPVAKDNLVFLWSDRGVVTCIEATTGKPHWQQRVNGNFFGSPVRVGNVVYCLGEKGNLEAIAAAAAFKHLGTTELGEDSRSTPAIAGGRMYLRTFSTLVSVGGKKG